MSRYVVYVQTGDLDSAGTNSTVYMQLKGALNGKPTQTPSIRLGSSGKDVFEQDALDIFKIDTSVEVGVITAVRIYHDNGGTNSGWYLEHVDLMDTVTGASYRAVFHRWLAKDESDGRIDVTVAATRQTWNRHGWMGSIYKHFKTTAGNAFGDVPLCQLPIPGSHDSGTYGMSDLAETQKQTIKEQLLLGIRFFDLRPKVHNGVYYIYHGLGQAGEGSSNELAKWGQDSDTWIDSTDADSTLQNYSCIFKDVRDFLVDNPLEIVILKFQSFAGHQSESFNPSDHIRFRTLIDRYLPLIGPRAVSEITLNRIYQKPGRVLAFYGGDLDTKDVSWARIWPYSPADQQAKNSTFLDIYDPYYLDDLGEAGADADAESFKNRWLPYHLQNLRDWQAGDLARFFVTQAQMQPRPGPTQTSAKTNNPLNIREFVGWLKGGVPVGRGVLRPNILTLDYIEYASLCDEIVAYFQSLSAAAFQTQFPFHGFDIVAVHVYEESGRPGCYRFSTGSSIVDPVKWVRQGTSFRARLMPAAGTIPVYEETNGRIYQYAVTPRPGPGWQRLGVAFHAYSAQRPGTVPVYVETPANDLHSRYHYSTRTAAEAAQWGWKQLLPAAFYAYEYATDVVPLYVYEETKRPGHYRLSQSIKIDYRDGWVRANSEFRAHRTQVAGTVPVHEEKNANGIYQYTANPAASRGWERLEVAFHACATPQPGTVPVYVETPAQNPHSRYNYSTRSAAEAARFGWKQLLAAFHAYSYDRG